MKRSNGNEGNLSLILQCSAIPVSTSRGMPAEHILLGSGQPQDIKDL